MPERGLVRRLEDNVARCVIGKPEVIRLAVVGLLARGHLLIEDVPGVGKTTLAAALARSIGGKFQRIQFTSDMLPSDILGVSIWEPEAGEFVFKPGPLFANIVLADEINRTTPKTQSSLLEAMNEARVSLNHVTHPLPAPFMVLATQNPREYEGTYPLPESQLDRFLLRIRIGYPGVSDEKAILRGAAVSPESLSAVLGDGEVRALQTQVERVKTEDSVLDYLMAVVGATRDSPLLALGVSPRGAQALLRSAQAAALADGRDYLVPDDVKRLAVAALAHRVIPKHDAGHGEASRLDGEAVVRAILHDVAVPPVIRIRFSPRRTLRPTREGWWCLLSAVGVGFAAVSTGNNLLYLLEAMLLGLVVVSGLLSEMSMRGLRLALRLPDEIFAGRPALLAVAIVNGKRRLPSYSLALSAPGHGEIVRYLPRLRAGEERLIAWETTFPTRGRAELSVLRVTTRFPFGLFAKSAPLAVDAEVIVYPALCPVPRAGWRRAGGTASGSPRRAGRGHGLRNLREYRAGDDPRLIHWRLSAKRRALVVRELEEETALDARLVLTGTGAHDAERRERALSEAASLARALLRDGAAVALIGPGLDVAAARGRDQERRLLRALALYEAPGPGASPPPGRRPRVTEREIVLSLD